VPNWCSNNFTTTNPDVIAKLRECAAEGKEDADILAAFVPPPTQLDGIHSGSATAGGKRVERWRTVDGENVAVSDKELGELQQNYGATCLYDWYVNNYGTKWDACNTVFTIVGDHEAVCHFDTAWSPPEAWLKKVAILHPQGELRLAYAEGGMGYFGVTAYEDGELVEATCHEGSFWNEDADEDADDLNAGLTPAVAEHLTTYGLHHGG